MNSSARVVWIFGRLKNVLFCVINIFLIFIIILDDFYISCPESIICCVVII